MVLVLTFFFFFFNIQITERDSNGGSRQHLLDQLPGPVRNSHFVS